MKLEPFDLEAAKKNPARVRHQVQNSSMPNEVFFPKDGRQGCVLYWNGGQNPSLGWYPAAVLRLTPDPDKIHPWDAKIYFAELGEWMPLPCPIGPMAGSRCMPAINFDGVLINPSHWLGMKRIIRP